MHGILNSVTLALEMLVKIGQQNGHFFKLVYRKEKTDIMFYFLFILIYIMNVIKTNSDKLSSVRLCKKQLPTVLQII